MSLSEWTRTAPNTEGAAGLPSSAPSSAPEGGFTPGTVLAARYRVVARLGRGGMGEVYRADDLKLGQPVALKFVRGPMSPELLKRLYAEVAVGRQVSHPNVCRLYDIVEFEHQTFLAMEYVDGEDLQSLLARIGRLPPDKALDIARDLCAGLAAVHEKGVIHRDLKPANVMIDGRGRARITDFGLAVVAAGVRPVRLRGHARLHVSRAAHGRRRDRAQRPVRAGPDPLRDGVGPAVLRRQERGRARGAASRGQGAPPLQRVASARTVGGTGRRPVPGGGPAQPSVLRPRGPRPPPGDGPPRSGGGGGRDALAGDRRRGGDGRRPLRGARPGWPWPSCSAGSCSRPGSPITSATSSAPCSRRRRRCMAERAREVVARLAPDSVAADEAYSFEWDVAYLAALDARDRSPDRWQRMAAEAVRAPLLLLPAEPAQADRGQSRRHGPRRRSARRTCPAWRRSCSRHAASS